MHEEAALHGALARGEQQENRGRALHHLHDCHREPASGRRTRTPSHGPSRMKTAVKTKVKKINNQALFGGSILKANMEVDVAIELAHGLDETGIT